MLTTAIYALSHFAVDLGCAFAAFRAMEAGAEGWLLYNFFAFAMQMPLGVLADRLGGGRWFAALGCALVALVCCLPSFGLWAVMVLGLGNGLFHVGGGVDVLSLSGQKAAPLGVFVSPGALGLFCGTLLGRGSFPALLIAGPVLLCGCLVLLLCRPRRALSPAPAGPGPSILPLAAALFLVVALRSFVGMAGSFSWKTGPWAWAAVLAVVLGKTAGGFLCDRFGPRSASLATLAPAALAFLFSDHAVPGAAALFLFNVTMPITLWALTRAMPHRKGFSFGLLTFALFLGFLPVYLGAPPVSGPVLSAASLLSAVLLTALPGRKEAVHG